MSLYGELAKCFAEGAAFMTGAGLPVLAVNWYRKKVEASLSIAETVAPEEPEGKEEVEPEQTKEEALEEALEGLDNDLEALDEELEEAQTDFNYHDEALNEAIRRRDEVLEQKAEVESDRKEIQAELDALRAAAAPTTPPADSPSA